MSFRSIDGKQALKCVHKRRVAVVLLGAALMLVHLVGTAEAQRTDGVCGGTGTYNAASGQCE